MSRSATKGMKKASPVVIEVGFSFVDFNYVFQAIANSDWAKGRSRDTIHRSLRNSVCFSAFRGTRQVGFCRVVTDFITIAYLDDLIIDPEFHGSGVGAALVQAAHGHTDLQRVTRWIARTEGMGDFYSQYGYRDLDGGMMLREAGGATPV